MPPVQKKSEQPEGLLRKGSIVNLVAGGRTLTGLEVLEYDDKFIKFRWDVHVAPQTEIVLVPWGKVEIVGLTDER